LPATAGLPQSRFETCSRPFVAATGTVRIKTLG